ncbi:MAG: phenylacetic acid degradation operon negative regulatory protein PaaX [Xanthomonadaceae bacterium]|nr:phenylacetic acid degradation operon negative regulatory protein PaaX [Xanthomonadaceae bacterium]
MKINAWLDQYVADEAPKSKSLIVTVLGDSVLPAAPGLWLSELIALMAPFGLSERLVRTSCFRLIEEGWLSTRRDGRRSHYSLTPLGQRRIELASQRIYTAPNGDWDGQWTLVITPRSAETLPNRVDLRRELEWEGFAPLATGVMIHPDAKQAVLQQLLGDLGLADRVLVFRGARPEGLGPAPEQPSMLAFWDLDEVRARYMRFIARFQPLVAALAATSLAPAQAFRVQTLMIHAFRRATLHDPRLPIPMLPADWPGIAAYALCRTLYAITAPLAHAHLASSCQWPQPGGGGERARRPGPPRFA